MRTRRTPELKPRFDNTLIRRKLPVVAEKPVLTATYAAMLPIGKPVKQLTCLRRDPVASFAAVDAFDGAAFGG